MPPLQIAASVTNLIGSVELSSDACAARHAGELFEAKTPAALIHQLADTLYQTLHVGRKKPLDIQLRSLRDRNFEALLHEATGERSTTMAVTVLSTEADHSIVDIEGLRLQVPNDALDRSGDGARVTLRCARPALSPGFFLATSGRVPFRPAKPLLRVYACLDDPESGPKIWRDLVSFLEDTGTPWKAKICSNPTFYPRNDGLVVYLPRSSWRNARTCADVLQQTGLLGEGMSPFVRPITASVGCAFDPDDARAAYHGLSFGQHRTKVFAEALVRHSAVAEGDREPVTSDLYAAFIDANIDPVDPARNLSSPAVDVLSRV